MMFSIKLENDRGVAVDGYTVKWYAFSTGSSGYTGSALYTMTNTTGGIYYANVTTTFKGTLVITASGSTAVVVPAYYKGYLLQGENQLTLKPGGTT